jgi:hypothetical protein
MLSFAVRERKTMIDENAETEAQASNLSTSSLIKLAIYLAILGAILFISPVG